MVSSTVFSFKLLLLQTTIPGSFMQKYIAIKDGGIIARLKLGAYYTQRVCTSRRLRWLATRVTVAGLTLAHGRPPRKDLLEPASINTLRTQGFVRLGKLLAPQQCEEMLDYLRPRKMVAKGKNGLPFDMTSVPEETSMGDYSLETVVNCPHVMDIANHPDVLNLAARYLGYTPTISLVSLRWSFSGGRADSEVQTFHRDSETGCIKLLVYLTDVDEDTGPHRYVAGSHRERMPLRLHRYSDHEVSHRYGESISVLGSSGTAFVIDSKGIHKGTAPVSGARLLLGIQYSLLPCLMYDYMPVRYRGHGKFDPYINRLMLKPAPRPGICQTEDELLSLAE
jgi:hypothetical protein